MRIAALLGLLSFLGCSAGSASKEAPDASAPPRAELAPLGVARQVPGVAARLTSRATLARTAAGYRSSGGLAVTVPLRASAPLHLAPADRPEAFLDVSVEAAAVEGAVEGGVVVYPKAFSGDDLLQVVHADRVEELRVLHAPRANVALRWTIRRGPAVETLRLVEGRVHAVVGGVAAIVSEPLVVVDAKGRERRGLLHLESQGDVSVVTADVDTHDLAFPVVVDPGWSRTFDKLNHLRERMAGVPLADGRVVVFPGWLSPIATPDLYDPVTDRFTKGPDALAGRSRAGAVRLASGKVLWFGGEFGTDHGTYEVWDPTTGSAAKKSMALTGVSGDAWTVLPSGKVFSLVGSGARAQIYDPSADAWTEVASAPTGHGDAAAVTLASGKVLLAGGCCSTANAEVYDPLTDTWTATFNMNGARVNPTLLVLPSGKVLVAGNDTGGGRAELFDPTTLKFTKLTAPVDLPGGKQHGIVLADGRALLIVPATKQTYYYTEAGGFVLGTDLQMTRANPVLAPLAGGRLLVVGGTGGSAGVDESRNTAEVWTDAVKTKTCTTTTDCGGGPCVDGYCCDRPCTETCYGCKVPGREGFCSPISGSAPTGSGKTCTPYLECYGGACKATCLSVTDCAAGLACLYGTCATKLAAGKGCLLGADCTSGNCVDGVCCDTACTEQCKACDVPGKLGACSTVTGAPHGTRTACTPYVCGATSCLTSCVTSADCAAGAYCSGGACVTTTKVVGATCTDPRECTSGFCVDGVCCNTACNQPCQTCGASGTCGFVTSGTPDPRKLCVGECTSGCGASGCAFKAATTPCGVSCVGSTLSSGGRCAGTSEACTGSSTAACPAGLYCGSSTACLAKCAKDADCVSGKCDATSGVCDALPVDAGPEAGDATSDAGDTGALDTGSVDTGSVDSGAPVDGGVDLGFADGAAPVIADRPALPPGAKTCGKDSECETGHCVEGVCCNTACEQKCHSCALLGSPGICTVEPVGVDLRQNCGPARTCLGTCDGAGECIGAGKGTMCARNRCTGPSTGVGPAYCAAPGAKCEESGSVAFDCGPYACAPAFGACLQSCATTADCANGFACDLPSKTCLPVEPPSSDSGCAVSSRGADGSAGLFLGLGALGVLLGRRRRRAGCARTMVDPGGLR